MNDTTVPISEVVQTLLNALIDREPKGISIETLRERLTEQVQVVQSPSLRTALLDTIQTLHFQRKKTL